MWWWKFGSIESEVKEYKDEKGKERGSEGEGSTRGGRVRVGEKGEDGRGEEGSGEEEEWEEEEDEEGEEGEEEGREEVVGGGRMNGIGVFILSSTFSLLSFLLSWTWKIKIKNVKIKN